MTKKIYNKLVRDKVPGIIKLNRGVPKIIPLDETEFRNALKTKMTEEAQELLAAKSAADVLNELADIAELIRSIAENYDLSFEAVENQRINKLRERGGFAQKLFLESVEEKR
jgi:predicted house-cleaning noncanonical NTP pyrophosphatase (MazG superfamily)